MAGPGVWGAQQLIDKPDDLLPIEPCKIEYLSRRELARRLIKINLTLGSKTKLEAKRKEELAEQNMASNGWAGVKHTLLSTKSNFTDPFLVSLLEKRIHGAKRKSVASLAQIRGGNEDAVVDMMEAVREGDEARRQLASLDQGRAAEADGQPDPAAEKGAGRPGSRRGSRMKSARKKLCKLSLLPKMHREAFMTG